MIKHNKLTILDLSKDEDISLSNTIIYQISYGTTKISNCKILKKNFFSEVKFKKYKNKINNLLVNFYKFLSKKKIHNDLIPLEILNQRNDKTQIFNKIFYLLEIKDYIAKNKINNVEIITDDETGFLINGEHQELADRITQLANNDLRLKIGNALREKVRNLYGWQGIIDQYMEIHA